MITEDYVSSGTAKLLKEKGFDEKCFNFYQDDTASNEGIKFDHWSGREYSNSEIGRRFAAPTLQMAMKWLREVHNKSIEVRSQGLLSTGLGWVTEIYNLKNQDEEYHNPFTQPSYEKACEAAIRYCLENLI